MFPETIKGLNHVLILILTTILIIFYQPQYEGDSVTVLFTISSCIVGDGRWGWWVEGDPCVCLSQCLRPSTCLTHLSVSLPVCLAACLSGQGPDCTLVQSKEDDFDWEQGDTRDPPAGIPAGNTSVCVSVYLSV